MTHKIEVCRGSTCGLRSKYIIERLTQVKDKGYDIEIIDGQCLDQCKHGPNMKIGETVYQHQNPVRSAEIVKEKVKKS